MAQDIVEIFEDFAAAQDYRYKYGNKAVLNLIQSRSADLPNEIHLLLENVRRKAEIGSSGLSRKAVVFSGRYFLVVPDDYSTHVYNENESQVSKSKYKEKILPLLTVWKALEAQFIACDGYDILSHENFDVVNELDANLTGLLCTYQIRVYEN